MIADHEAIVASRFDALHRRFKRQLGQDDPRLQGIVNSFRPLDGRRFLDLGCGKGRFSRALAERGAVVVGLDLSAAMLHGAANSAARSAVPVAGAVSRYGSPAWRRSTCR